MASSVKKIIGTYGLKDATGIEAEESDSLVLRDKLRYFVIPKQLSSSAQ